MVVVPDFPEQPYNLPVFLQDLIETHFRVYSLTEEDREKTIQYKANAKRALSQKAFVDMDSFIESLDIHLDIESAHQFNIPRIAQMTQKTNQFNLTTKRYTEADVQSRIEEGWSVYCLRVSDRFGDSGITGCVFIHQDEIDSFLLSCRILGKGIEYAFLKAVMSLLKKDGVENLSAKYFPTAKNSQVKVFYDRCGFSLVDESADGVKSYSINLRTADLATKSYYCIRIVD
jgi:FkbH-like protein